MLFLFKLITCSFTSQSNNCTQRKSRKELHQLYRCIIICSYKFRKIHRKTLVSFFNKVTGLRPVTLLKKRLWHRCLPVNFTKFLRTVFFTSQNTSVSCFCKCLKIQFSSHIARCSSSQMFFKIRVLINFVMFTRRHLKLSCRL